MSPDSEQTVVIEDLPWDPTHQWQEGDLLTIGGEGWVRQFHIVDVTFPHPNKNWARLKLRPVLLDSPGKSSVIDPE